jgi:hypothetical protein
VDIDKFGKMNFILLFAVNNLTIKKTLQPAYYRSYIGLNFKKELMNLDYPNLSPGVKQ